VTWKYCDYLSPETDTHKSKGFFSKHGGDFDQVNLVDFQKSKGMHGIPADNRVLSQRNLHYPDHKK